MQQKVVGSGTEHLGQSMSTRIDMRYTNLAYDALGGAKLLLQENNEANFLVIISVCC